MKFTPLSDDERLDFERDGYLVVRQAISPEMVNRLLAVSDRLIASGETRGRQTIGDGRFDSFRNVISFDAAYVELLTHDETLPRVLQLMSPNLQLHTSHLIYTKSSPPGSTRETVKRSPGWHRDINTFPRDLGHQAAVRAEIKVAFQLSDASKPNSGQTAVIPGSHRWTEKPEYLKNGDPENVVEPLLAPGDVMLFENRTWHAGGYNFTGQTRKTLMLGYSYKWMKPDDYVFQSDETIAQCTPIAQQLIGHLGGYFQRDGSFSLSNDERPLTDWCRMHDIGYAWEKEPALAL